MQPLTSVVNEAKRLPPLVKFSAILLTVALFGAFILVLFGEAVAASMHIEVFRLLAQLLIVAGIGGAVSLLYQEISEARQKQDQETKILRETLSTLSQIYNECKCVRRSLRAIAIRPRDDGIKIIVRDAYSLLLARLNDAHLQVEFYKRYISWNPGLYNNHSKISSLLEAAEKYLNNTIDEWEKQCRKLI